MAKFQVRYYFRFRQYGRQVMKLVNKAAKAALEEGYAVARKKVPVRTGELQSSIYASTDVTRRGVNIELGADAPYAGFVEYGTSRMRAQPYLRPGTDALRRRFKKEIG